MVINLVNLVAYEAWNKKVVIIESAKVEMKMEGTCLSM